MTEIEMNPVEERIKLDATHNLQYKYIVPTAFAFSIMNTAAEEAVKQIISKSDFAYSNFFNELIQINKESCVCNCENIMNAVPESCYYTFKEVKYLDIWYSTQGKSFLTPAGLQALKDLREIPLDVDPYLYDGIPILHKLRVDIIKAFSAEYFINKDPAWSKVTAYMRSVGI